MDYEEKKRWLWRYQESLREEQLLKEEIEQLQAEAERVTPCLTGVPGGGSSQGDKLPKAVEKILKTKEELELCVESRMKTREEIQAVVKSMSNNQNQKVLMYRYIVGHTWAQVAEKMGIDERTAYRKAKEAIKNLQIPKEERGK